MLNEKTLEGFKAQVLEQIEENWQAIQSEANTEFKANKNSKMETKISCDFYINDKGHLEHETSITYGINRPKSKAKSEPKEYDNTPDMFEEKPLNQTKLGKAGVK